MAFFFFLRMGFWHLLVLGNNFTSRKHPTILHSEPTQAFPQQLGFCLRLKGNSQVALYDNAVHFIFIHSFFSFHLTVHFNSMETSIWSYASQLLASQPSLGEVQYEQTGHDWRQLRYPTLLWQGKP